MHQSNVNINGCKRPILSTYATTRNSDTTNKMRNSQSKACCCSNQVQYVKFTRSRSVPYCPASSRSFTSSSLLPMRNDYNKNSNKKNRSKKTTKVSSKDEFNVSNLRQNHESHLDQSQFEKNVASTSKFNLGDSNLEWNEHLRALQEEYTKLVL